MAEITTYKGSHGATTGTVQTELGRDVSPVLWHMTDARNTPLIVLMGGDLYQDGEATPQKVPGIISKETAISYKYDVIEKADLDRNWQINGAITDTTTTTLVFDSTAGMQAGMLLRQKSATWPEVVFVQTVTNTTTVTAARNLGSTAYQVADDSVWECIGFAQKEGGSKRAIRAVLAAARTRYLQVFRNTAGITKQLDEMELVTKINSWDEEMKQAARQHNLDKEFSAWMNPYADSTLDASSNYVYLARGILSEIENYDPDGDTTYPNVINCNGDMTEDDFFGAVSEKVFDKGPGRKALFADGAFLTYINKWASVKQQLKPEMTTYGLAVSKLITIHGDYDIYHIGTFSKFHPTANAGFAAVLNLDKLVYKYLPGFDQRWADGIQTPGDLVKEGDFVSECGFSLRNLEQHLIIKNIKSV